MYVYSVGARLCGTHVRITDFTKDAAPSLVHCFHNTLPGHRLGALAFHVYADLLYFSDVTDETIRRFRMQTTGEQVAVVAANTGKVGGPLLLPELRFLCVPFSSMSPPRTPFGHI